MRSAQYEQALTNQGVDFVYMERLNLEAVDTAAGLRNQARLLEPLDEELIAQYANLYKQGSDGPPLVVYKKKNRNIWIPIDGNQRVAAAKRANKKTLDAYIVQTDDSMILDRITWVFNNLVNGKRLSREECLEHAETMVRKYGVDVKTAAKEWGVGHSTLSNKIAVSKAKDTLRGRNASSVCDVGDKKIELLLPIISLGEDVFTNAVATVKRCGLGDEDIKVMKREVDSAKTHEAKVKAVVDFGESELVKQRRAETKGGTIKPKQKGLLPSERLVQHAKVIQKLLDDYDKTALRRSGSTFKETQELIQDIVHRLAIMFGTGKCPHE